MRFTSPRTGTTDANGYFTVSGRMLKKADLTLSVGLSAPEGWARVARDPRFNPAATGFSQRVILADTKPLSVSQSQTVRLPDPKVVTSASPGRVSPGETVTETVTLTDAGAGGSLTVRLYGPFRSKPGASSCTAGKRVESKQVRVTRDGTTRLTFTPSPGIQGRAVRHTFVAVLERHDGKNATHARGEATGTLQCRPKPRTTAEAVTRENGQVMHKRQPVEDNATITGVLEGGDLDVVLCGPFDEPPAPGSCVDETTAGDAVA